MSRREKPSSPRRPKPKASPHEKGSRPPCPDCKQPWPHHLNGCYRV